MQGGLGSRIACIYTYLTGPFRDDSESLILLYPCRYALPTLYATIANQFGQCLTRYFDCTEMRVENGSVGLFLGPR